MSKEVIHDGAHIFGEDIFSNKVYRIFYNDHAGIEKLVHDECNYRILVVEIGIAKTYIWAVNLWLKVTIFIQGKITFKLKFEVLDNQLHLAYIGQKPKVDILWGINLPVLDSWELYFY